MPTGLRMLLTGLGCFAAAVICILLSRGSSPLATIWLPNAILLAVALRAPYRQIWPVVITGAAAGLCANLATDVSPGLAAGYAFANLVSVLVPLLALRPADSQPFLLTERPTSAVRLILVVATGTMLSALVGGALLATVHARPLPASIGNWLTSDLTGMVAVLPLGLRASLRESHYWFAAGRRTEILLLYGLTIAGTFASLQLSPFPFVTIELPLLLASFRLGLGGTALLCACESLLFAALLSVLPPVPMQMALQTYGPGINALAQFAPLAVAWLLECRSADMGRLRASEERLRSAMRDSAIGMALIDLEGRFVAVNPALCALGGHEAQALLGHHFADFLHGPDRYVAQELARQLAEGTIGSTRYELRGLRADGSLHWLRVVASCMRDGQQRPTGFIAQIEDIDVQRQAERARTEQAALIERAHDAIIGRDAEGRVTHWNRGAERLYGWSAAEMTGQPLHERLDTHNAVSGAADEPERTALDYWEGTLLQRHRDGHALTIESRRVLLRGPDGRLSATLEINRDVSTLREAVHLHAQFVALVARELRAPLTTIGGTLDLIASGALGTVSGEAQDLIDIARRHDARLMRIVADIQDAERIAAGDVPLAPQTIALAALLGQLRDEYAAAADAAGIRIDIDAAGELSVNADPERLTQVLGHLLDNALRHAPAGSAVTLRALKLPGRRAGIEVCDRGAGVPAELRPRLFHRFLQGPVETGRPAGGAGLGLYIARELTERQGGTINYETGPEGTCLHLELPLAVVTSTHSERPHVLVVEDDALAASAFVAELSRDGYIAEVAGSVRAAREKLAVGRYALVTVDMLLPDGMGEEVIRAMREDPRHVAVPVMVVSALPQGSLEAVALPVADWLPKPVRPERLQAAIAALGVHAERAQVLHVENDPGMREYVRRLLGPRVKLFDAETLSEAEHLAATLPFDLAILDLLLPDGYGLAVAPKLHTAGGEPTPVLVFSAGEPDPAQWQAIAGTLSKASATGKDLLRTVGSLLGRDREGPPHE